MQQQRDFASIQTKIALALLILGVIVSFVVEDWVLILVCTESVAFFFFLMSRAKFGFCDLQEIIQILDRKTKDQ